jgi:hypothetical protein
MHVNARIGSGGVGMFVRQSFLAKYKATVIDDSTEDVLWVKFSDGRSEDICVCVCYLPPSNSTRANDAEQFFTTLLDQVSRFQNDGLMYICGDFNARCGDDVDYVEGVDKVCVREIIDDGSNHYGDLLTEFMIDCNISMCNGRIVNGQNNYTHVSHRGKSVVDYVLVPHEQMQFVSSFNVHLMTDTAEALLLQGSEQIPDHSIIVWSCACLVSTTDNSGSHASPNVIPKYHVKHVLDDFMCTNDTIRESIRKIEDNLLEAEEADSAYNDFQHMIRTEMETKLDKR